MTKWDSAAVLFRKREGASYSYLLQHRHARIWFSEPGHGANLLGLPGGMRSKHDTYSSDTAFREALEESAPFLNKSLFLSAIVQTVPLQKHMYFIVDADGLQAPEDWVGCATDEVDVSVFKTGHVWATEAQLKTLLQDDGVVLNWPVMWAPVKMALRKLWYALGISKPFLLYHGTTVASAQAILASKTFKVLNDAVACTGCKRRPCTCGPMLGPGVYLAQMDKANSNAGRAGSWALDKDADGLIRGCILECSVQLGKCKIAAWTSMCGCGCKFVGGVDHHGRWHPEFDSIYLEGGGPAAKRPEWCVRDPARVVPLRYKPVWWTPDCKFVKEGDWVYPAADVAGIPALQ